MRLLIDTQCWLWMQTEPERFSAATLKILRNPDNARLLSVASAWEIAIKYALAKLPLPLAPSQYVPSRMEKSATTSLPIEQAHALQVSMLPHHHRDPFDRLIIAQAQLEGLPVLTSDPVFKRYDVELRQP